MLVVAHLVYKTVKMPTPSAPHQAGHVDGGSPGVQDCEDADPLRPSSSKSCWLSVGAPGFPPWSNGFESFALQPTLILF